MEYKIELVKGFLRQELEQFQLQHLYNENVIVDYFHEPHNDTSNAQSVALAIFDMIITGKA